MELKAAFDFSPLTRCLAIVSHISQLQEPPSHRGLRISPWYRWRGAVPA